MTPEDRERIRVALVGLGDAHAQLAHALRVAATAVASLPVVDDRPKPGPRIPPVEPGVDRIHR